MRMGKIQFGKLVRIEPSLKRDTRYNYQGLLMKRALVWKVRHTFLSRIQNHIRTQRMNQKRHQDNFNGPS